RRELRSVRADCCDDLLLNAGIAERESYCEILLQAAGHMAQPRWARAALGICERFHPLGQRFKRIMDASLKRPRRLSWAGLLAVLALALLLIPGVRFVEGQATDNAAAVEAEIGRSYAQADADVKDFIKMTAERFGPKGLWLPENAFDKLTPEERASKLKGITETLEGPDTDNTCTALAEAGVLRDPSLLPVLVKVAGICGKAAKTTALSGWPSPPWDALATNRRCRC
ncbi:MAG: hypothetical protein NTU83_06030, partial [Candidatus Hydrogenedentes bacterium]|nr:hypothetical protein [Candidatus Hydrogenedentota bacterium]